MSSHSVSQVNTPEQSSYNSNRDSRIIKDPHKVRKLVNLDVGDYIRRVGRAVLAFLKIVRLSVEEISMHTEDGVLYLYVA